MIGIHFNWDGGYKDSDFEEIDERRIERPFKVVEDKWKKGFDDLLDTALGLKEPLR